MRWSDFVTACPRIAELAEARFRADELVFLGTIRPDGTARVSPCEIDVAAAAYLRFGECGEARVWDPGRGPRERPLH